MLQENLRPPAVLAASSPQRSAIITAPGQAGEGDPPDGDAPRGLIDGRYQLLRKLGAGGMGIVYLAEDVQLARRVALKVLARGLVANPDAAAQLLREARALASLRNPHVVGVHAFGKHEDSYFFAMEFIEGVDLRSSLDDALPSPKRVLAILSDVCDGLAAVHDAGLVHRDVKPENVLLEASSGRAVLADFGLVDASLGKGLLGGTPDYSPIEQLLGEPSSPSFDVYAFGVLAFELATGRLPYGARTLTGALLDDAPAPLPVSAFNPGLSALDGVVARALDRDPSRRYASAREMKQHLALTVRAASMKADKLLRPEIDRVLVVEPHSQLRETLKQALSTAFFWAPVDVALVDNWRDAESKVREWSPDLLVIGAGMGAGAVPPPSLAARVESDGLRILSVRMLPELGDSKRMNAGEAVASARVGDIVRALQALTRAARRG